VRGAVRAGLRVLPMAVSLACLAAVVVWALGQRAPAVPAPGRAAAALAVGLALYALATAARAERWYRLLARLGLRTSRRDALGLTLVGYMGNNVLPARAGDLLRAYLMAGRTGGGKRTVLGTAVAERVLDALALGGILVLVSVAALHTDPLVGRVARPVGIALAAVLVLGMLLWALRRLPVLVRARAAAAPLATSTRELASRQGVALLGVSAGIWAMEGFAYATAAVAAGLPLRPADAIYVMAIANLGGLVPAGPGYVGTYDALVLFAVRHFGASASAALTELVLLRLLLFVPITLAGLIALLTRYGGWRRPRLSARAQPAGGVQP